MKKSTKKIEKILKDLPQMKTSDDFTDKVHDSIREYRAEWDDVSFDSEGNVDIGNDVLARPWTWTAWMAFLWIVLSFPLYVGILNAYTTNDIEIIPIVVPITEEPIMLEILEDVEIFTPVEDDILDPIHIHEIEPVSIDPIGYNEPQFIWEAEDTFNKAFRLARLYLGPNEIFNWHGNEYTTMYVEEVVLYNN